jgi:superfamily I DNA/RNA helicase
MTVAFTPEQLAAVERRDGPMLLSANAGSGKTAVLTERVVRAVLEDGLALDELLVITFTEKAAGELRSRIREGLAARGARAEARDTERAWISTIHGFCARVLRAHAVAAGLDPSFSVLDEATGRRLRGQAWDETLAAFMDAPGAGGAGRPEALELAATWGPDRLKAAIEEAHGALRAQGMTVPRLPPCRPRRTVPEACAALDAARAALLEELPEGGGKLLLARARRARALREALARGPDAGRPPRGLRFKRGARRSARSARRRTSTRSSASSRRSSTARRAGPRAARRAARLLRGRLRRPQARALGLDFDDLELGARDLLASAPAVAEAVREPLRRIMVDEFQDTNDLQMQLLGSWTATTSSSSGTSCSPSTASATRRRRLPAPAPPPPRPLAGARARPELAHAPRAAPARQRRVGRRPRRLRPACPGRPEAGTGRGPSCSWPTRRGTSPARRAPARSRRPCGPGCRREPGSRGSPRPAPSPGACARCATQGQATPEECVVLTRAATDLHVFERALEREGFATLASAGRGYWLRQPVQDLTAYLAVLANPHDDLALYGALASRCAACPRRARARRHRGAGRRAPSLGGAETDRSRGGSRARPAGARRLPRARGRRARRRPAPGLDEVLERAVLATGYDLHVLRLPGGRRRLANVHKLVRLAGVFEEARGRDLRGFIDHARAEVEAQAREAEAPVELAGSRAVRLMTIHAAKGLEFGTVVVADLGRQNQSRQPDLLVDGGRVGLRLVRMGERNADALDYAELKAEAQAAALAEERRVLHVAVTRAEERLILSGVAALGDDWARESVTAPALSWLGRALGEALPHRLAAEGELELDELRDLGRVHLVARAVSPATAAATLGLSPPAPEQLSFALGGEEEAASARPRSPAPARPRGHLPASLAAAPAPPARSAAPPPRFPATSRTPSSPSTRPAATATTCAGSWGCPTRRRPRPPRPRRPPGPRRSTRATAAPSSTRCSSTPTRAARRAPPCWRTSWPSSASRSPPGRPRRRSPSPPPSPPPRSRRARPPPAGCAARRRSTSRSTPGDPEVPLLTGVVDLLAEEEDGTTLVVDHKTDRVADAGPLEAHVAARYGIQRALYALAALEAGARRVEVAHLFLERPGEPATAVYDQADRDALRARLRAQAAPLLHGEFPVTERPHVALCGTCPGRGTCARSPRRSPCGRRPTTLPQPPRARARRPARDARASAGARRAGGRRAAPSRRARSPRSARRRTGTRWPPGRSTAAGSPPRRTRRRRRRRSRSSARRRPAPSRRRST